MKELMKKLGVKEQNVDLDVVATDESFLEIEDVEQLGDYDEMPGAKVYLRTSQKQVYELREEKKYAVAHIECGFNHVFYSGLTKNEVIELVKTNFNDYVGAYILIFEQDDWISVEDYVSLFRKQEELTFEEPVLVIDKGIPINLKTGDGLILSTLTEMAIVFRHKDAVQIKNLKQGNLYTVVNVSDDGMLIEEFGRSLSSQKVIEMVDEYIHKYADKKMFIFNHEAGIYLKQYAEKVQEDKKAVKKESDNACYCCGEDVSNAMWHDIAMLRGIILETSQVVPIDGDIYNCDEWFNKVETKFRKMGVLKPNESVYDLEGTEFFTLAFSDTFPSEGKEKIECLSDIGELRGFESGAYCLHCHASL